MEGKRLCEMSVSEESLHRSRLMSDSLLNMILDCSGPTTSVTALYLWQRDFNVQPLNMFLTPLAISTSMCALSSERRCICGYKKAGSCLCGCSDL
ncbi:hypothetical protein BRARA_D00519 [Brassica rapa]|uniref:Uncharacterized protein n=1 Tax=Brassica campestris TaxID=3711 RepID=A0A397ZJY0_BRACM|nr:hypothetical protein BRARA_D00519 [Brassica rapa]